MKAPAVQGLQPGTVIAGVTVIDQLGHGGFGITYLAEEPRSRRRYALKEYFPVGSAIRARNCSVEALPDARTTFQTGLSAFYEEAETLRRLPRQPGLVSVSGAFKKHGTVYCLMEFIDGRPLDELLAACAEGRRPVPDAYVTRFLRSIASALSVVHASGRIHGDIKPANVMIRERDGQPVLVDFGASRRFGRAEDLAKMFTPAYAPIEQFPVDWATLGLGVREGPWSDIFSLSVLLYQMMSHRLPRDARERLIALQAEKGDSYLPLARAVEASGHGHRYSRRLTDLVDYGCRLFPRDRPADATAFAELLDVGHAPDASRLHKHSRFGAAEPVSNVAALTTAIVQAMPGPPPPVMSQDAHPFAGSGRDQRPLVVVLLLLLAALAVVIVAVALGPVSGGAI